MHILLIQPVKTGIWTLRAGVDPLQHIFLGPSRLWPGTRKRQESTGKLWNVFNKREIIS